MATRFPETEPINVPLDTFTRVEQDIRCYFDTIIRTVTIKRDQLLQQLQDLKLDYFNKEELRKKQVRELEKMIGQLDEMSIQQNPNLKFHEDHIKNTEEELRKAERPTPVPVPHFSREDLQPLLQQLERLGTVQEVSRLYSDKLKPVRSIGKEGTKKGELLGPQGIRIDEGEKIYVCDYGNSRIQVFSKEGKFLTQFGKGQLGKPHDIAFYDRWAFVSESGNSSILKFQISNFKLVNKSVEGVVSFPRGLTVDRNEVLVADSYHNMIAGLNLELEYLREIGKGILKAPCDVKINSNKIFVLEENESHNVHVFSRSADLLYSMINVKNGTSYMFMCLDQFSNLIISDYKDKSIQIFTLEGQLIHSIQCEEYPNGVAVTNNNTIVCAEESDSIMFY